MGKRYGVIDIGTRGVRYLIATASRDGRLSNVVTDGDLGALGAGMDTDSFLSEESMTRVMAIVQRFNAQFLAQKVDTSFIVCTEIVRIARNSDDFLSRLRQIIPEVLVLTPAEEASYSFRAAYAAFPDRIHSGDRTLVIDQGGGSVELSSGKLIGGNFEQRCSVSWQIGTVALSTLVLNAPSLLEGYRTAEQMVQEAVEANTTLAILLSEPPATIFGMGSAIRRFAESQSGRKNAHGYTVTFTEIENSIHFLQQIFTLEDEDGFPSRKADDPTLTTACGLLTFYHVLRKFKGSNVIFCREGLSYGVLRMMALQDLKTADDL